MCGIAGIILKQTVSFNINEKLIAMSEALSHRGPDGEGFMTVNKDSIQPHFNILQNNYQRKDLPYIPQTKLSLNSEGIQTAFAHRRLAIIDLSESGHQPMCSKDSKTWITYNGELYNYLELREELKKLGHTFISESDTEVILGAYKEWGKTCVKKFNGMWSFCIYDSVNQKYFASRDRLGVKPFYYINNSSYLAFASEQKAFIKSGLADSKINEEALHNYLVNGLLETGTQNFFDAITELWPGHNLFYDSKSQELVTEAYFHIEDEESLLNDGLSESELIDKISHSLETAIRLRLRSDVKVGVCLSGGIDSSALAVSIAEYNKDPLSCFTAIFKNQSINEEHFADIVSQKINGLQYKIEPDLNGFMKEVDDLVYSQDVPIWSTSTYAQYKVMQLAHQNHIKVVLDGQGADELFGGYHHHFIARWNNLLSQGKFVEGFKDIQQSKKTIPNAFTFYLKENLKEKFYFNKKHFSTFFSSDFLNSHAIKNPFVYFDSVNEQLKNDIYKTRLKSFLKCEDRCGMWHSVESRTPFSDDTDLINLLFSFNGNKKIKHGVSKYLLREAVKNKLPKEIYSRYDKKGFETPMRQWMQVLKPQLINEVKAANFEFVNNKQLDSIAIDSNFQSNLLFKLFILSRWKKVFKS